MQQLISNDVMLLSGGMRCEAKNHKLSGQHPLGRFTIVDYFDGPECLMQGQWVSVRRFWIPLQDFPNDSFSQSVHTS